MSFLELQIQQAKDSYESALKNVIEECITLEIQATKKEETQLIMDLLPAIGTAIQNYKVPNVTNTYKVSISLRWCLHSYSMAQSLP